MRTKTKIILLILSPLISIPFIFEGDWTNSYILGIPTLLGIIGTMGLITEYGILFWEKNYTIVLLAPFSLYLLYVSWTDGNLLLILSSLAACYACIPAAYRRITKPHEFKDRIYE